VPLRFIKVLPDVTFRFDFELTDGILEKERKTILFAQILSDLGIGAKSNVGYGKFSSNLVSKAKLAVESQKEEELKKEKEREAIQKAENEAKILSSLDSNVEKIQIQIKDFTKKETKNIHDIIVTYELNDSEKKDVYYRLLKNPNYNWRKLLSLSSLKILSLLHKVQDKKAIKLSISTLYSFTAFAGSIATSAFSINIFFQFCKFLGFILFVLAISFKVFSSFKTSNTNLVFNCVEYFVIFLLIFIPSIFIV